MRNNDENAEDKALEKIFRIIVMPFHMPSKKGRRPCLVKGRVEKHDNSAQKCFVKSCSKSRLGIMTSMPFEKVLGMT